MRNTVGTKDNICVVGENGLFSWVSPEVSLFGLFQSFVEGLRCAGKFRVNEKQVAFTNCVQQTNVVVLLS